MRLACKSRVCKIPARGFQESLYITTLFAAYKRPSLFYVSQHLGRKAYECVTRPSPLYGKGNKTRWQVVFGVLFLGKLCSNIPTVQVCHEVEGRAGGDRQHARHTPGTCHGGNTARSPAHEFSTRLAYKRQPGLP